MLLRHLGEHKVENCYPCEDFYCELCYGDISFDAIAAEPIILIQRDTIEQKIENDGVGSKKVWSIYDELVAEEEDYKLVVIDYN